ncbi:hypothetical protein [Bradyrhizobium diazoefficiens]|uniref:hypothetical protein n=1 Tax=Bradyrhizobium diazoefficiens TaxID=1355477 RepID=UPI0004B54022|nr:hypothetical protein [Bradyrhizobium diazoefficiens]
MIRLKDDGPFEEARHLAWLEGLTADERILVHTPAGYWHDLVNIAMVKRLLKQEMPADLRLRFLEHLNAQVHSLLTLEAMQAVEPACDTAMSMIDEMKALSIDDKCRLMCKWNVMAAFCNLNPSLIEAMKKCCQ